MTTSHEHDQLAAWLETLRAKYVASTPESARLAELASGALPGGDTRAFTSLWPYPVYGREATGSSLTDIDDNTYVDFSFNATSLAIGHAHPAVVAAVTAQVARGTAWSPRNPGEVELAQMLVDRVPSIELARFANSGTEAVMMAVRLARTFTGRSAVIRASGSYHGVWDEVANDARGIGEPARPWMRQATYNDLESFARTAREVGDDLAAVLVAPAFTGGGQSSHGYVLPDPGFLEGLAQLCRDAGALLIFDEVLTLRLGVGGAQQRFDVRPDLTAMGKIIGGGLAVGAVGGRSDVLAISDPTLPDALPLSGTYNGNPLMTAAGIATLRELTGAEIDRINAIGEDIQGRLAALNSEHGDRFAISGCGSLFALQLRDFPGDGWAVAHRALKLYFTLQGVLGWPYFSVSTATTADDVEALMSAAKGAMRTVAELLSAAEAATHV